MPTLLRLCLSGLLIISLATSTTAQRTARRRAVVVSEENTSPTTSLQDSANTKKYVLHCEKRTIPGVLFSRADLIRMQRELANLKYSCLETEDTIASKSIPLIQDISTTEKKMEIPDCRETKAINKANIADAYPYLTEDGLRLYFTSNREGGHGRFFICTRKSIRDPFGEPEVLSKNLTDGYYAGTLTADELTLCMFKSGSIYISVRKNKNEEFPIPVIVTGTSDIDFGPSISPDGKEIIVTVTLAGKVRARLYKRTDTYQVGASKELPEPVDGKSGPGQFSKDGLYYYLSIETKTSRHLWRYSRASLSDNFSKLEELPVQIKGLRCIIQPSLNSDGSVLVFVTNHQNLWEADDIILVNNFKSELNLPKLPGNILSNIGATVKMSLEISMPQLIDYSDTYIRNPDKQEVLSGMPGGLMVRSNNSATTGKMMTAPSLLQMKVYPNPFTTIIHIEINDMPAEGVFFNLYDISGKKIQQVKINNIRTTISFDQLIRGIYSFEIVNRKGELISSGKLIKIE